MNYFRMMKYGIASKNAILGLSCQQQQLVYGSPSSHLGSSPLLYCQLSLDDQSCTLQQCSTGNDSGKAMNETRQHIGQQDVDHPEFACYHMLSKI